MPLARQPPNATNQALDVALWAAPRLKPRGCRHVLKTIRHDHEAVFNSKNRDVVREANMTPVSEGLSGLSANFFDDHSRSTIESNNKLKDRLRDTQMF